jgi:hypothetical protein
VGRSARASGGVLLRSEHLQLRAALARATAAGRLVTVLPDVYVAARSAGREACIAAVIRRFPDAVLCGPTAAQLTFWPALKHDTVRVANVRARFGHPGYRWERRVVPPEWVEARTANHLVRIRGRTYYLDIAFVAQHVAVEIDGRLHERDPAAFENDRRRQNDLVFAGWRMLRFARRMLKDEPDHVVSVIRAALRQAG